MSRIGVVGAGAFGTALACSLTRAGHHAILWGRDTNQIAEIQKTGRNEKYLPDLNLPDQVHATFDLSDLAEASALLMVVPAQQLRTFLQANDLSVVNCPIVLCAKGIEKETGALQSEIIQEFLPGREIAVLSGPGFATEMTMGKPTALSLACANLETGAMLQRELSSPVLRLYLSDDVVGTQLSGALKNVYAIACGLVVGARLGESARAALMTRGFAELSRLIQEFGTDMTTAAGLSGLGDLALTCTSMQSRNFAFGEKLGREGAFGTGKTVEGIATARATTDLARQHNVEMPIASVVADVLEKNLTLNEALDTLMSRPLTTET